MKTEEFDEFRKHQYCDNKKCSGYSKVGGKNIFTDLTVVEEDRHIQCIILSHSFLNSHQLPFQLSFAKKSTAVDMPPALGMPILPKVGKIKTRNQSIVNEIKIKYLECKEVGKIPTVKEIAADYGITAPTLNNIFNALEGKPFYQLYMEKKMAYAAKLLAQRLHCQQYIDNSRLLTPYQVQ